ncbi:MAG TPA: hypothetical protein PLD19_01535 [Luteimonas sp.]|nr:hypothetical protein [Luteimonas sp.]
MLIVRMAMLACGLLAATATAAATEAPRVDGEPSRTPAPKSVEAWRAADIPAGAVARMRYGEMSAQRILALKQANESRAGKPMQIGIAREAATESTSRTLPALHWIAQADGSHVARLEFVSPLAYGIRAGLRIEGLPARAELRFSGSLRPDTIVATLRGGQLRALAGDDGLFWTPGTDGEKQFMELWLPAGAPPAGVRIEAPRLSHLMTNALEDFKILEKVGESGSCNIDTVCRVGTLGPSFANTVSSVARMVYVKEGSSWLCTGTLLNDMDNASQIPWFHTANHCIPSQTIASTLNTYWKYEATACSSGILGNYTLLSGGADHLYSSAATDGALLRLRDDAPAGAHFAGWDAGALPASTAVTAIHHPSGDVKKVSFGQHRPNRSDSVNHGVGWLEGTTEGGSSGSGLFTLSGGGYYLRGGLYGGEASCANTGSLATVSNVDWYSRFDVDFPHFRQYLAPVFTQPRRRNGSQPLARP